MHQQNQNEREEGHKKGQQEEVSGLELATTEQLIEELKARHDHSCFVGYRQLTKDSCDYVCSWRGDSKTVCGMLFQGSYAIANEVFKVS